MSAPPAICMSVGQTPCTSFWKQQLGMSKACLFTGIPKESQGIPKEFDEMPGTSINRVHL